MYEFYFAFAQSGKLRALLNVRMFAAANKRHIAMWIQYVDGCLNMKSTCRKMLEYRLIITLWHIRYGQFKAYGDLLQFTNWSPIHCSGNPFTTICNHT